MTPTDQPGSPHRARRGRRLRLRGLLLVVALVGLGVWTTQVPGVRSWWFRQRGDPARAWREAAAGLPGWLSRRQLILALIETAQLGGNTAEQDEAHAACERLATMLHSLEYRAATMEQLLRCDLRRLAGLERTSAFESCDPELFPLLLAGLKSDPENELWANALVACGDAVRPLAPQLRELCEAQSLRGGALLVLSVLGEVPVEWVPRLTRSIEGSRDETVVRALASLGRAAAPAVPALLKQLGVLVTQEDVLWALCCVGTGDPTVVEALRERRLEVKDPAEQLDLLGAILLVDPAAPERGELVAALRGPSKALISHLNGSAYVDESHWQGRLAYWLHAWRLQGPGVLTELRAALASGDSDRQQVAMFVCRGLGKGAEELAPLIAEHLSGSLGLIAQAVLGDMQPEGEGFVEELLVRLRAGDADAHGRQLVLGLLARMQPAPEVILPALVAGMCDGPYSVAQAELVALDAYARTAGGACVLAGTPTQPGLRAAALEKLQSRYAAWVGRLEHGSRAQIHPDLRVKLLVCMLRIAGDDEVVRRQAVALLRATDSWLLAAALEAAGVPAERWVR